MKRNLSIILILILGNDCISQEWHQNIQLTNGNYILHPTDSLAKMTFGDGTVRWTFDNGNIFETDRIAIDSTLILAYSTDHSCGVENVHNINLPYGTLMDQEGNEYRTIVIGNQRWMAENLKTSKYRNGENITQLSQSEWSNASGGAWMYYNDNPDLNCPHGKFYNWYAIQDNRHICPTGWHVPTIADHNELVKELDPFATADGGSLIVYRNNLLRPLVNSQGSTLYSNGLWLYENSHTNSSGLSFLPSGIIVNQSSYGQGEEAYFWLAHASPNFSNPDLLDGWFIYTSDFSSNSPDFAELNVDASTTIGLGLNVRCVQDDFGGLVPGCTNPVACNYNAMAEIDDNSCRMQGQSCDDGSATTYNDFYNDWCYCTGSVSNIPHSCGLTYFHKAGLNYGSVQDQEGNQYRTIVIGNQEWMAENLNTSIYQNGLPLDTIPDGNNFSDLITGAWSYLNGDISNACSKGKLYNWEAVINPAGICPVGWHVPSASEIDTLLHNADPEYDAHFPVFEGWIAARHLLRESQSLNSVDNLSVSWSGQSWFNSTTNNTGFSASKSGLYRYYYNSYEDPYDEFLCWSRSLSPEWMDPQGGRYVLRIGIEPFSTYYITPNTSGAAVVTTSSKDALPIRCLRD